MNPEDAISSLSGTWNVGTLPQGNWFLPQDAQIRPRTGLLEKARDYIYGSEVGRRAMSAVDMWNSLTGGVRGVLGNVAPGTQQAITPALERLVGEGQIGRTTNLLGGARGYFMDQMGDVYDIGDAYTGDTHIGVLEKIGAIPARKISMLGQGLNDSDLIRIRQFPPEFGSEIQMEMTKMPSNAAMEQLIALFERQPQARVSLQLHQFGANPKHLGSLFTKPSEAIDAIYKFFGK